MVRLKSHRLRFRWRGRGQSLCAWREEWPQVRNSLAQHQRAKPGRWRKGSRCPPLQGWSSPLDSQQLPLREDLRPRGRWEVWLRMMLSTSSSPEAAPAPRSRASSGTRRRSGRRIAAHHHHRGLINKLDSKGGRLRSTDATRPLG